MSILFKQMVLLYTVAAVLSLILTRYHRLNNIITNLLSAAASFCGIIFSLKYLYLSLPAAELLRFEATVPFLSIVLRVDNLSAFFVLSLSVLTLCVSLYSLGYMKHYFAKNNIGVFNFLLNIFILSMLCVITSANMISFLISWEIMSLVSFALVVFESQDPENSRAGLIYIIMTHIGTAFLIIAFMLIYVQTGSFEISSIGNLLSPHIKNILFLLFMLGFGVKAGIIPLHVWLPYAHPAALSNISALMSGIMIKTAVYGLLRFVLVVLGASNTWWGITILLLGVLSTALGIAYALMEHNYKRLLAYSSIENIGIIMIGVGISITAYAEHQTAIAGIALLAALFHVINHTFFKGALFLGAGAIHYAAHTKNLEDLGGLMKRLPYTGLFILLASLSISALPPFNGFVSEWLTFQALFQVLANLSIGLKILAMLSVAVLGMAGALAAACFIKFIGIAFLGKPRSEQAQTAREVPFTMLLGMGMLVLLCLLAGLFPQFILMLLDSVTQELFGFSPIPGLKGFSFLPYFELPINKTGVSPFIIIFMCLAILFIFYFFIKYIGRNSRQRLFKTWDCGFGDLNPRMQYTATGFSKPLRIVFRLLYQPKRELQLTQGPSPYYPNEQNYVVSTETVFEKYIYRPLTLSFTHWARKTIFYVQTGSVHIYLIYILAALILLLVYNWIF